MMTMDQAADILEAIIVAFPRHGLTDAGIEHWIEAIADCGADPVKSLEIARRWGRTRERFPSLAEVLVVIAPRPVIEAEGPDEWRASPVVARKMVALWREELTKVDKRRANLGSTRGLDGHWHGTPGQPCPVCGGCKAFR